MMGTGKTSLAHLLSKQLTVPCIDTDNDLISILNLNMEEIFESFSEEKFRILESTYFIEHLKNNQHIYATGGGIILNKNNRMAMKKYGRSILLIAPITSIYDRLISDNSQSRPLFIKNKNKKFLQNMWDDRKKYYQECADFIVETEKKSLNEISDEIAALLDL